MASPGFWDRQEAAREVMAEAARLKEWVNPWNSLNAKSAELGEIADLLKEEGDPALEEEWLREVDQLEKDLGGLEIRTMLQGENDHRGAILTIHPGAGGTESQDWAE